MLHEPRRRRSWLIFDVGQKMKPVSPFPEGVPPPHIEATVPHLNIAAERFYPYAACSFAWAPALVVVLFYAGDASVNVVPMMKPIFALALVANPLCLMASLVVLALSRRKSRWLSIALTGVTLLLECIIISFGIAGSAGIYR
jgi:hypothetical protein